MTDRKMLSQLIELITDLIRKEDNRWMVAELLSKIQSIVPESELAGNPIIQKINEYCIEDRITTQAEDFYKDFKLTSLVPQLIEDFKKMEHERRRDDFHGFCLSMFQQLEAIVNHLFQSDDLREKLKRDRDGYVYSKYDKSTGSQVRGGPDKLLPFLLMRRNRIWENDKSLPYYDVSDSVINRYFDQTNLPIIDYDPTKKSWAFINRFRAILFYYYYDEKVFPSGHFNEVYSPGSDLYTMRNQNHRESSPTESQKETIERVHRTKSAHYLKFYGFLEDFVSTINKHIPQERPIQIGIEELKFSVKQKSDGSNPQPIIKSKKKQRPGNTLADNPEFNKILKEVKKKLP